MEQHGETEAFHKHFRLVSGFNKGGEVSGVSRFMHMKVTSNSNGHRAREFH
jgi:hypothetical protein